MIETKKEINKFYNWFDSKLINQLEIEIKRYNRLIEYAKFIIYLLFVIFFVFIIIPYIMRLI